jgi:hypothetical protein
VDVVVAKDNASEVPPPGAGLTTVMLAVPALAMSEAGTAADTCEALTGVVGSAVLFQCTTDADTKLLPFTVSVKDAPPAGVLAGTSEPMTGTVLELLELLEPAGDADMLVPPQLHSRSAVTAALKTDRRSIICRNIQSWGILRYVLCVIGVLRPRPRNDFG